MLFNDLVFKCYCKKAKIAYRSEIFVSAIALKFSKFENKAIFNCTLIEPGSSIKGGN